MFFPIISSVFWAAGIACLLGLTPERVTDDLMAILRPKDSLREKCRALREHKQRHTLYRTLVRLRTALTATGKSRQFALVCAASLVLFVAGLLLSVLIHNIYLMPALSVAFALTPFVYALSALSLYEQKTKEELETTLSIITTSYLRSGDILRAVRENLIYIRPPLQDVFRSFLGEAKAVNSNIKQALNHLKDKVDDEIYREWCDTLIQCQDDRTLIDTLPPVVAKLTDVRLVNSELKTMLASARSEYLVMVGLVVGNIPLLYLLNKDWYATLMITTPGKVVLGICGIVILITAMFLVKFTRPIEYKR